MIKHKIKLKHAIYPGTFDPFTNGHLDILRRALVVFPKITILVAKSSRKQELFTIDERIKMIQDSIAKFKGISVDVWDGLTMDYAKQSRAIAVIRGLRGSADFEYEFMMATMNKEINPNVETVFLMTSKDLTFVSSSMIKELYLAGGDISAYVPKPVVKMLTIKAAHKS